MKASILYHPAFQDHRLVAGYHPECPARLDAAIRGLERCGYWQTAAHPEARPATALELERVHSKLYVETVFDTLAPGAHGHLDGDTFFCPGTLNAALLAAGGGIELARSVQRREVDFGFALVRPPGHHAGKKRPSGFCVFNNIGVAVRNLLVAGDIRRAAIVDWDVHHGNGTEEQFWYDPDVLFFSIHQWPHYPGTGAVEHLGGVGALGKNVNVPMPAGTDDDTYLQVFEEILLPLLRAFAPDHIFVSCGFDAHRQDPLGGMNVTTAGFEEMARRVSLAAGELCGGRLTLFLEGGYNLPAVEESVAAVFRGISSDRTQKIVRLAIPKRQRDGMDYVIRTISPHWPGVWDESAL